MKLKIVLTAFLIILLAAGSVSNAGAGPWRGYKHYYRHGWYDGDNDYYGPRYHYRYYPVMRYSDGCRRYCPKYDGCRRCYEHSGSRYYYEYRK